MNNLYQALGAFMQEAETFIACESDNHPEINEAFDRLNALYKRLSDEADQTTTATPTKLIVITYQSYVEEVIPYSLKALEFISDNLGSIDNIRILELREL